MYQSVGTAEGGSSLSPTVFRVQVEKFRFIAYMFFWGMCIFAIICSTFTVAPNLGPCPESPGAEPTYGMHCSVLMSVFGFNNICVFWDYSPAREATAMVYPLFEYSLLVYVIFDYLQIRNDYENGKCGAGIYNTVSTLLWVKIVLIAWFRMIFVCSVFQNAIPFFGGEMPAVVGHTLGFFGMQFALVLIAFENVTYLIYNENGMFGLDAKTTKPLSIAYLVTLALVTALKISWASSLFIFGTPWIGAPWPHIFDRVWMLLVALGPVFFSLYGMKHEPDMVITIVNEEK